MMRILFSTMPASGHLRALVPIAHAAIVAGHEVAMCTPASAKAQVTSYGLTHLPAGRDWVGEQLVAAADETETPPDHAERLTHHLNTEGYPGPEALRTARDIIGHAQTWRPDVIVRENAEFGGYLAAEALGLPHASVGASPAYMDPALFAPGLDAGRAALGLPPDPTGRRSNAPLHATLIPPELDPGEHVVPNSRAYRQTNPALPGERLPDWVAGFGEPVVFAAFGTMYSKLAAWHPVIRAVIAGLGLLGLPTVVAAGIPTAPFEPAPSNVRLVERIAQPALLECSALFLHHGGFNSIRESLRLGVPMVIIPWVTDSLINARGCAEAGVSTTLYQDALTPESVRDACAAMLAEPAYARRAAAVRTRMLTLPPLDELVADIVALAR